MFNRHSEKWRSPTRVFLLILSALFLTTSCSFKWSKEDLALIRSRQVWSHSFPAIVSGYDFSPNGVVTVDLANKERWILHGETGKPLWKMNNQSGIILSDSDPLIITEIGENKHTLAAISYTGENIWLKNLDETLITGAVNITEGIVFSVSASQLNQGKDSSKISADRYR